MEKEINNTFNRAFCRKLEYHLCYKFKESNDINVKRFWCDGIYALPFVCEEDNAEYLSIKEVTKRKYIETSAHLGVSGQDTYQMKIILGMNAQKAYGNGSEMLDCISNKALSKWLEIDTVERTIIVKLK
jgi:hypothetical protein